MLRQDITTASQHILAGIEKSGLSSLVENLRNLPPGERGRLVGNALHCYVEYMVYSSKYFGENEKKILRIFNLEYLEDKEWWGAFLDLSDKSERERGRGPIENIGKLFSTIRFTTEQLPKVIDLIQIDNQRYMKTAEKSFGTKNVDIQEII